MVTREYAKNPDIMSPLVPTNSSKKRGVEFSTQEEDKEGQVALILDDPGTAEPADFWLHPCDCTLPAAIL